MLAILTSPDQTGTPYGVFHACGTVLTFHEGEGREYPSSRLPPPLGKVDVAWFCGGRCPPDHLSCRDRPAERRILMKCFCARGYWVLLGLLVLGAATPGV